MVEESVEGSVLGADTEFLMGEEPDSDEMPPIEEDREAFFDSDSAQEEVTADAE